MNVLLVAVTMNQIHSRKNGSFFFFPSSLGNIELLLWRYRNVKKVYSCAFTQRIVCQGYVQSEPEELKLLHVQGAAAPHYPVQM